MGIGIWAMHFKALLAFRLPVRVDYHLPTVLASLVIGVLASAIALYIATRQEMGSVQAWTGSLIMGGGVAAMHYVGMAAMRMPAITRFDPLFVALSVVLAILFSRLALMFTFDYRDDFRGTTLAKVISAAVMGAAISLMHYTGMAAVTFMPAAVFPNVSHTVSISPLANNGILIVTILVLGTAILTSSVDRQTQVEVLRLNESLEQRVVERTRQLTTANEELRREIAERRRAEVHLAMAQRMARMGVWSWNPSSGDMFGSEEFYRIFGIDPDKTKLTRDIFLQRIHPDDRPRYESEISTAVAERRNWELDYRIVLPDSPFRDVHAIGKPVFNKSGDVLEFVGTTLDITERKRAEQELRQAQERIRAILENSPNLIFLKDTEGRYLLVNREFERALRVSQEQIKGKTDEEVFPPEQAAVFRANDLEVLRAGVAMEFEEIAAYEDGPHTSIVYKFPLFDTHGNIYATGGVATDITERKRAEEARRHSEEQYRTVVETAHDGVISIDEDSQILFVNPAAIRIFGYEASELIGRPLTMLMPKFLSEVHKVGLKRYLATGQRHIDWQGTELVGLRKNADEFPVEVSFGEVIRERRHIFTGFIRDITDRKHAEEELRKLSGRLLRAQDEERRRIAQDLHDSTGQNLVALATMLGQLQDSIPSDERKLGRLYSDCKVLAEQCIREIRTLSYLLHPPVLDQAGLGDAIRDYVGGFTKRSGIQVELELSPRLGRMERDVELALFRVVQESLTNIQRHSGSQRATIRINRNSDLTLEISDLGPSLPASVQTRKDKPRFETGVGIPSMHERVKLIGGRFDFESSSHGTTVRVTIPLGGERT
jgi:PAS domain S-box-containing protein